MVPAPKVQLPTFQDPQLFIQAVTHSSYDGHSGGGASRAQGLLLPLNPALELEGWAWEDQGLSYRRGCMPMSGWSFWGMRF